jgi:hypothetical protein
MPLASSVSGCDVGGGTRIIRFSPRDSIDMARFNQNKITQPEIGIAQQIVIDSTLNEIRREAGNANPKALEMTADLDPIARA